VPFVDETDAQHSALAEFSKPFVHGTGHGYHVGCRCAKCRGANVARMACHRRQIGDHSPKKIREQLRRLASLTRRRPAAANAPLYNYLLNSAPRTTDDGLHEVPT
jgi:hypothetical protein